MALTWNTAGVENHDEVCWFTAEEDIPSHFVEKGKVYLRPITNALIWHSLNTGIGTITAENAAEVWARVHFVETVYGASLWNSEGPKPLTKDDVLKHVGLETNASFKDESRASFLKRHATRFLDEQKRSFEKLREAEVA